MGKDTLEFARIASPEEIAEYLSSLAGGLKRGEITLDSGEQTLRLTPASDVKLELRVKQKEQKGKLDLEIGWKRVSTTRTTDLQVRVGPRPDRS